MLTILLLKTAGFIIAIGQPGTEAVIVSFRGITEDDEALRVTLSTLLELGNCAFPFRFKDG